MLRNYGLTVTHEASTLQNTVSLVPIYEQADDGTITINRHKDCGNWVQYAPFHRDSSRSLTGYDAQEEKTEPFRGLAAKHKFTRVLYSCSDASHCIKHTKVATALPPLLMHQWNQLTPHRALRSAPDSHHIYLHHIPP